MHASLCPAALKSEFKQFLLNKIKIFFVEETFYANFTLKPDRNLRTKIAQLTLIETSAKNFPRTSDSC